MTRPNLSTDTIIIANQLKEKPTLTYPTLVYIGNVCYFREYTAQQRKRLLENQK